MLRAIIRNLLAGAALLALYVVAPVPEGTSITVLGALVFVGGVAGLAVVTILLVQRVRFPDEDGPDVRTEAFILLGYAIIVFFALAYLFLARDPGQFDGLTTRIDALYFTIVTAGTVGYGDIHPAGQAARSAVTIQIVFNLVFLATAVKVLGPVFERRRAARRERRKADSGS